MHARTHTRTHARTDTCTHACTHVHTHAHTHAHTPFTFCCGGIGVGAEAKFGARTEMFCGGATWYDGNGCCGWTNRRPGAGFSVGLFNGWMGVRGLKGLAFTNG